MTEYVTGQIYGWNGGECPVHPETEIKIWTRNGLFCSELLTLAKNCFWDHAQLSRDIIAFQVVEPYVKPKVLKQLEDKVKETKATYLATDSRTSLSDFSRAAFAYMDAKAALRAELEGKEEATGTAWRGRE